jgi:hypothetical protein
MLGLFDTAVIKSKTQTSDNRGGVDTALVTKIAALTCSIQPIRREENRFDLNGEIVIDPNIMMYENITSGPTVDVNDVVVFGGKNYLVINVASASGLGTHSEAILKEISGDAYSA